MRKIFPAKRVRFRAKMSKSGNKIHIIVPKMYHRDIIENGFLGEIVQVEIRDVSTMAGDIDLDLGL